jgi:enamine deaminase RidA (YjgF/YER057c/UK114 family)
MAPKTTTVPPLDADEELPRALLPKGWPRPSGYANGMTAKGRLVLTGGVVGWDAMGNFAPDFAGQARQTFSNIMTILAEGGAGPEHIVRLTWYVVDLKEYRASLSGLGRAYREFRRTRGEDRDRGDGGGAGLAVSPRKPFSLRRFRSKNFSFSPLPPTPLSSPGPVRRGALSRGVVWAEQDAAPAVVSRKDGTGSPGAPSAGTTTGCQELAEKGQPDESPDGPSKRAAPG